MFHIIAGGLAAGLQVSIIILWWVQRESVSFTEAATATVLLWLTIDALMKRVKQ